MITRREALYAGAAAGLALTSPGAAVAQDVSTKELEVAGPLGDVWLGPADAKVTIIEYASLTCPHCATFHKETFPVLKERYIDTGKVRFTLREFPLDARATAGFMLARCDGNDKYYPITDLLFDQQPAWAFVKPDVFLESLEKLMRQAGFSKEKIETCLNDKKLLDAVNAVKDRGLKVLKVESTPTFFINGKRESGHIPVAELEKMMQPILGG